MPFKISVIILGLFIGGAVRDRCVADSSATEATKLFNELYKERILTVKRSISRDDDVELASEFMRVARESPVGTALFVLLTENAYELALRSKESYPLAMEAMTLLGEKVEAKQTEARAKFLNVLDRQYRTSTGKERRAFGERLINEYMGDAEIADKANRLDDALSNYRQALSIVIRLRIDGADLLKDRIEVIVDRQRTLLTVERLEQSVLRDADDTASAKQLTLILLNQLNDPVRANSYASRSGDDELKEMTPLAAKPITEVSQADRLALGLWYKGLADNARGSERVVPLERAKAYLTVFLAGSKAGSKAGDNATITEQTRARLILNSVTTRLDELGATRFSFTDALTRAAYIDMEHVKKAFGLGSGWKVNAGVLSGHWGEVDAEKPRLRVPVRATTVRYGFKIKAKWYHVGFIKLMDRDGAVCLFSAGHWWNRNHLVKMPKGEARLPGSVANGNDWCDVEIQSDGKQVSFFYQGKVAASRPLEPPFKHGERLSVGFGTHRGNFQIKDLYLILDGKPLKELPLPE